MLADNCEQMNWSVKLCRKIACTNNYSTTMFVTGKFLSSLFLFDERNPFPIGPPDPVVEGAGMSAYKTGVT